MWICKSAVHSQLLQEGGVDFSTFSTLIYGQWWIGSPQDDKQSFSHSPAFLWDGYSCECYILSQPNLLTLTSPFKDLITINLLVKTRPLPFLHLTDSRKAPDSSEVCRVIQQQQADNSWRHTCIDKAGKIFIQKSTIQIKNNLLTFHVY